MSNSTPKPKKVIQIKQADFFQRTDEVSAPNQAEMYHQIVEKIHHAKNELTSIEKRQAELLQQTKLQIEQEKQQWQEEKEQLIKQAKEEGYADGFASGKQESINQYEHLLTKANSIVDQATTDYHTTIEKYEDAIIQLAIHTAEVIIKQKLTEEPSSFVPIVKSAIEELKEQPLVKIYVHSNHYAEVLDAKLELEQLLEDGAKLSIYVEDDLDEHGCVIDHPVGKLDASVDTQLKQIRSTLEQIAQGNKE